MTTMTIHAEDTFAEALKNYAQKEGKSVNQTVKDILSPILGIETGNTISENPFLEFCGVITPDDAEKLTDSVSSQRQINPEDWK